MSQTAQDLAAKRARDRQYSRAYRERKRRAEQEAVAAAHAASEPPGELSAALESALAAMKWLKDSDGASVAQARMLARDVDGLVAAGSSAKALRTHSLLRQVLAELGGTPRVRMQHELRSARLATAADAANTPSNVTAIASPRPPKRRSQ